MKYKVTMLTIIVVCFTLLIYLEVSKPKEQNKPQASEISTSNLSGGLSSSRPQRLRMSWEQHAQKNPKLAFSNLTWKPEFGLWQSADEKSTFGVKLSEAGSDPAEALADKFISDLHKSNFRFIAGKLEDNQLFWVTYEEISLEHQFFVRVWWKDTGNRVLTATALLHKSKDLKAGTEEFHLETDKLFHPLTLALYGFNPSEIDSRAATSDRQTY